MYAINQGCMLCQPINWSMTVILHDSVRRHRRHLIVRTRPPAKPLAMITMRKSIHGFFLRFFIIWLVHCPVSSGKKIVSEAKAGSPKFSFVICAVKNIFRESYNFLLFLYQRNWKKRKLKSLTRIKTKKTQILIMRLINLILPQKTANPKHNMAWRHGNGFISKKTRIGNCATYLRENWIRCCAIFCNLIVLYVDSYPKESEFLSKPMSTARQTIYLTLQVTNCLLTKLN